MQLLAAGGEHHSSNRGAGNSASADTLGFGKHGSCIALQQSTNKQNELAWVYFIALKSLQVAKRGVDTQLQLSYLQAMTAA